jgi:hypothetical protein
MAGMGELWLGLGPPGPAARRGAGGALAVAAAFAALSLYCAVKSDGFLEGDAVTHFVGARSAVEEPARLLGIWGRPVVTAIYALPAYFIGVVGVRATSLLLALVAALATYRVAANQGCRFPGVAAIALCAQPLFFLHSFSELTELPFATLAILGFWAYQKRQWLALAIIAGLLPATRPEGFGFLLLAAAGLAAHRRPQWLPQLIAPLVVWSSLGWLYFSNQPDYGWGQGSWLLWLAENWPYSSQSTYPSGPLLLFKEQANGHVSVSFLLRLPVVVSPFFFPALCAGVACCWARRGAAGEAAPTSADAGHARRCALLIAAIPLAVLAIHSVLWWRGKQGSSGELRYLLTVGPFWALLCARGWEWVFGRFGWRGPILWACVGALVPIGANFAYPVVPIRGYEGESLGRAVAQWYRGNEWVRTNYGRIMASPPSIPLFLDVRKRDAFHLSHLSRTNVAANPRGSIIIWDAGFGPTNASEELAVGLERIEAADWVYLGAFECRGVRYEIFLSSLTADGRPTREVLGEDQRLGEVEVPMR